MKEFFCRLFTPWRAGAQFDAPEAFYGFLLARNKLLGIIRNLCFGAALVLLIVGYAVSDGTSEYSIGDIANQPFYLIAVGVMVIALLLFVGIPLPGTGAWTGTLAASLLDMDFKSSVRACMGGVLLAGCIMGVLSVLGVSAFGAVVA